jgi:hypothetical protein
MRIMNEIATLEQARAADLALAGSAGNVFLRIVTDEDRGWEKVCVECPVGEVKCSEDVLARALTELNRLHVNAGGAGEAYDAWICYRVLPAAARSKPGMDEGEFVGRTFVGYELKKEGFSVPLLNVLHGDSTSLFAAILATRDANPRLFNLLQGLLETDEDLFRPLIMEGVDVNTKGDDNFTLLHCACHSGRPELVEFLLCQGADVRAQHAYTGDPFSYVLLDVPFNEEDRRRDNDAQILRLLADFGATITCDHALRVIKEDADELRSQFGDGIPETILYPKTNDDLRQLLKEAGLYDRLQGG